MANVVEIVLRAVDKTKQGFTTPIKNLNDLGKAADKLKPAFLALSATVATAFGLMAKHSIENADQMGKLAQKAGTTVEQFSALNYVADLANVETEKLTKSYKELSRLLVEAQDPSSKAANTFRSMGIEIRDANGNIVSADAAMENIADRFADTADGAQKVSAAVDLFGSKLGQDMIPFLNQGASEIRNLRNEALLFGQVVDEKTAKAAEKFNDNLTKLKLILQGVVNQVVAEFLPAAADMVESFVEWIKTSGAFNFAVGVMIDGFKTIIYVVQLLSTSMRALWQVFRTVGEGISDIFEAITNVVGGLAQTVGSAVAIVEEIWKGHWSNAETMADESLDRMTTNLSVWKEQFVNIGKDAAKGFGEAIQMLSNGPTAPIFGEHEGPDGSIVVQKESEEQQITAIHQKYQSMRELLDEAANEGHLSRFIALRDTESAYELQKLEERKQYIQAYADFYAEAHRGAFSYIAEASKTVYAGIGNAITGIVMGTKTAAEAFKDLGKQMIAMVVNFMAQRAVAFALEKIMAAAGLAMQKLAVTSATAAAAAMAAAWAPAATAAAIATFGAATAAGAAVPALMAANAAAGSAIALGAGVLGQAHDGMSNIPREGTWMLDGGERVVPPEQNQDLTAFLNGNGGGPTQVSIYLDGEILGRGVGQLSRDGRLEISARAIV